MEKATIDYAGKRIAVFSLGLNLTLAAAKYLLYLNTNSSALLAEAVHSLTDVIGSILVVMGIYISGKKSKQFPWGLYKIENIAAVLSAGLIFLSAYEIAVMLYHPSPAGMANIDIALVALLLMTLPVMLFSMYEAKKAKAMNSPSLAADAENWRMDIAPLAIVFAGLVGARFSYAFMDRIAALLVLIPVVRSGYMILKDSMKSLLDASVDRETLERIRAAIDGFPQVKEIVDLNARNSGRFIFVHADLSLSVRRLKEAHAIALDIEREMRDRVPFVERVVIHYEPERKEYKRYAVPLKNREGDISGHFGRAPFIAVWDVRLSDSAVPSREILENPFVKLEKGKGVRLAELLVEKGIDVVYAQERFEGKSPERAFSNAEVEVRVTDLTRLDALISTTRAPNEAVMNQLANP